MLQQLGSSFVIPGEVRDVQGYGHRGRGRGGGGLRQAGTHARQTEIAAYISIKQCGTAYEGNVY